jgi:hypothetical protein
MSGEFTTTAFCPNEAFTCSSHLRQQPQPASRNIVGLAACAAPAVPVRSARASKERRMDDMEKLPENKTGSLAVAFAAAQANYPIG